MKEDKEAINDMHVHGLHGCGRCTTEIKRDNFAEDEEDLIIRLHALLGNRWSLIARRLPGRTETEVKDHWNSNLRRKLANVGIDPDNHRLDKTLPWSYVSSDNESFRSREILSELPKSPCEISDSNSSTSDPKLDLTIACPSTASSAVHAK